jgi:hypothetical protein
MRGPARAENFEIPTHFWSAPGRASSKQDWETGDFESWSQNKIHLRAYGVEFQQKGILEMLGVSSDPVLELEAVAPAEAPSRGGRPSAKWWDDLWVEICSDLYNGDLTPESQADIERAMFDWLATKQLHSAESTVRERARKLWKAIGKKG